MLFEYYLIIGMIMLLLLSIGYVLGRGELMTYQLNHRLEKLEDKNVKKYRKKPIIVEAYQTDKVLYIDTLEGRMRADKEDFIITGVNGEQYPCKPTIFKRTYEEVKEDANNKRD